jgi:hypothetical protein
MKDRDIIVDGHVEFFDDDSVEDILEAYTEKGYVHERPPAEADESEKREVARRFKELNDEDGTGSHVVAASQIARDSELSTKEVARVLSHWNNKYEPELQPDGDQTYKWHLNLIWGEIRDLLD